MKWDGAKKKSNTIFPLSRLEWRKFWSVEIRAELSILMLKTHDILRYRMLSRIRSLFYDFRPREVGIEAWGKCQVDETHLKRWLWLKSIIEMRKKALRIITLSNNEMFLMKTHKTKLYVSTSNRILSWYFSVVFSFLLHVDTEREKFPLDFLGFSSVEKKNISKRNFFYIKNFLLR